MLKTYIDVPRQDYIYHMVHDLITLDNGWDVLTTVYKPNYVRFYFSYKYWKEKKLTEVRWLIDSTKLHLSSIDMRK